VSHATNPVAGERVTFWELFERHSIVEVPIIQRDYVQGRPSEVSKEFLDALYTALSKPEGDSSLPLDLDFIYGSVEGTDRQAFCPLDGQQRLTTLFLLHWYLAWRDGKGDHFANFIRKKGRSRLAYAVRPSSGEFFDAMVCWYPYMTPAHVLSLSEVIADQPWFFRSWSLDPTIHAALAMLDALHEKFAVAEGFYSRLLNTERPYITFQLLDLRNLGLSDDLYIKMNARGKPLTTFETFKARLEQHLGDLFLKEKRDLYGKPHSLKDYFSHRMDTAWADLFWHHRDRRTHLFDDKIMHLIRALAIVTRDPNEDGADPVLQQLRSSWVSFSFLKYQESRCLDKPLLETLIAILDEWAGGSEGIRTHLPNADYFDERRIFDKVIQNGTELTYEELVQFRAYCAYLVKHRSNLLPESFNEWMRVIKNLALNTTYDRLDDYKRSIRSVTEMLDESHRILEHISDRNVEVQGFNEQQIREEKLKAQLINRSKEWRALILRAEQHGYFNGQIEFLLKFAGILDRWVRNNSVNWSEQDDIAYRAAFTDYYLKAAALFSADGLNQFGEYCWERALLSVGNYLLAKGRSNYSFLTASDRDASWKRLLRGAIRADDPTEIKRLYVKDLLDQIDLNIGVETSLNSVIEKAIPTDEWRRVIVAKHELVGFCRNRMIRWQSKDCVYLLRKSRMSGEHAELFTFNLKVGLLSDKYKRGELSPFAEPTYTTVNTDTEEPHVSLIWTMDHGTIVLSIFNKGEAYELKIFNRHGGLPAELITQFTSQTAFRATADGTMWQVVERRHMADAIDQVVSVVRR